MVSANFFRILGVPPLLGRDFLPEEEKPGAHVVMLSHSLWQSSFGGAPDVAGRTITLDGLSYIVAGVMPAGFHFPDADSEIWRPYTQLLPYQWPKRDSDALCVLGRLKDGGADREDEGRYNRAAGPAAQHSGQFSSCET